MVQRKRTYRKKTYKRKTYKRRYYKRRYYKRRYKPIKKPEIHIIEHNYDNVAFNNTTNGMGYFNNLTTITSNSDADIDNIVFNLDGKPIQGKKIRLKYLYIKGFIMLSGDSATYTESQTQTGGASGHILDAVDDNFNCKLMVFRWKRNTSNNTLVWSTLINGVSSNTPTNWTGNDVLNMMYKQDWKNDLKINFYKKVKNLYRKYDNTNNIIPFKIRIPLYDCVLTCDTSFTPSIGTYEAQSNPATNGLYFTFLSNAYNNTTINYKTKLYYTDY